MRKNLKEFRLARGFTQEQMAEFLGYSRTYYSSIELGLKRGTVDFWNTLKNKFNIESSDMWNLTEKA